MCSNTSVAASGRGGGLHVVENAGEEAGEEEGAKWEVEDEDVVNEAIVFQPK